MTDQLSADFPHICVNRTGGFVQIENPKQLRASSEMIDAIVANLSSDRGVHAETAISAASRMAGTLLLHSSGLPLSDVKPGRPVFSDVMNDLGQKLLRVVDQALASTRMPFDASKINYDLPDEHSPRMELIKMQSVLEEPFRSILGKYDLTEEQGAVAAALATAALIQKCSGILDPHVGYVVAVYGLVQGCKTVPFRPDIRDETTTAVGC